MVMPEPSAPEPATATYQYVLVQYFFQLQEARVPAVRVRVHPAQHQLAEGGRVHLCHHRQGRIPAVPVLVPVPVPVDWWRVLEGREGGGDSGVRSVCVGS